MKPIVSSSNIITTEYTGLVWGIFWREKCHPLKVCVMVLGIHVKKYILFHIKKEEDIIIIIISLLWR